MSIRLHHAFLATCLLSSLPLLAADVASPPQPPLAATDVKVVCDRWPDGSSMRQFALDAIRLSDAKTEKEKALAIYRWMRRWTMFTTGKVPDERGRHVLDDLKILNVYGAHWCDGRALLMENLWRSVGGRAYKLYVPEGYTMALVNWKDDDGVERWHQIHASRGWYVYDREGKWVATPDQIAADFSLMFRPSRTGIPRTGHPPRPWNWIVAGHRMFSAHNVALDLRPGDTYSRLWGNQGIPACDNVSTNQYDDGEHGPYPITYGNGRLTTRIDLNGPAVKTANDKRELACSIRAPHVVADAWLEGDLPKGTDIRLAPEETPRYPAARPREERVELRRDVKGDRNVAGRYQLPLRFSWPAAEPVGTSVVLNVVVQHNLFSLPQLWPGRNTITVSGNLSTGTALRVTYEWSDADGADKRNVTVVERAPHPYEILAAGGKWTDVRCKQLTIEAVAATGAGNRTEVKEPAAEIKPLPPPPPIDDIVGDRKPDPLKTAAQYLDDLKIPERRNDALHGLMVLRDKSAAPALIDLLYSDEAMPFDTRGRICQAIYLSLDNKSAFDALLPVVAQDNRVKWIQNTETWRTVSSLIAHLAGESNYQPAIPVLITAYKRGVHPANAPAYHRAFGKLKARDAVPLCDRALMEHSDVSMSAAWALGEIGDASVIPDLVKAVEFRFEKSRYQACLFAETAAALGKLGARTPEALALLERMLSYPDEEVRGLGAEALGKVGTSSHIPLLRRAAQTETYPWVKDLMEKSANALDRQGK